MAQSFTLYKHCKNPDGKWRYFRAVISSNNKLKPHAVWVGDEEMIVPDGSYCVRHRNQWIDVGNDPAEAIRQRTKLSEASDPEPVPAPTTKGTPLKEAMEKYLSDLEALGREADTISTYRRDITPFVNYCKAACVEDVKRQDLLDYMRWQRKQPVQKRRHSNPERTYHNRCINVRSFLNAFGVSKLFRKGEYRKQYHEKKVVAHTESELSVLYAHANANERFIMDYFIGTMVRDHEAYGARYSDLTGCTLTVRGKGNKTRTVEISPRLADSVIWIPPGCRPEAIQRT